MEVDAGGERDAGAGVDAGASSGNAYVEQFKILCKPTSGKATAALIEKALAHKHIMFFSDFLELDCVQKLSSSSDPECRSAFTKLEIFAYGNYEDFCRKSSELSPLTEPQARKLRQLSLVEMASGGKPLAYAELGEALALESDRALEDLIIGSIYEGLVKGQLDHRARLFRAHGAVGRDVTPARVDEMLAQISSWCQGADQVLAKLSAASEYAQKENEESEAGQAKVEKQLKDQYLKAKATEKNKQPLSMAKKMGDTMMHAMEVTP